MSIEVTLPQLAETLTRYHFAYLLTVGGDARAHVVAATATLANDTLRVTDLGRRTRVNLAAHPSVTLARWRDVGMRRSPVVLEGSPVRHGGRAGTGPYSPVIPSSAETKPSGRRVGLVGGS
jgi:hypothetical protein